MDIQLQELIAVYKEKASNLDHDIMIYKLVMKKQENRIAELSEKVEELNKENDDFVKELEVLKSDLNN